MKTTQADRDSQKGVRWAEDARTHGHGPDYFNDSECGGCAALTAKDAALAAWAHRYANLVTKAQGAKEES